MNKKHAAPAAARTSRHQHSCLFASISAIVLALSSYAHAEDAAAPTSSTMSLLTARTVPREASKVAVGSAYFQADGEDDGSDAAAAVGTHALAAGALSFALGDGSSAYGAGAAALGQDSTALGGFSLATQEGSLSVGFGTVSQAAYATALGYGSVANGTGASVLGYGASADGVQSVAIGGQGDLPIDIFRPELGTYSASTKAGGDFAVAIGTGATAMEEAAVSLGVGSEANGAATIALGLRAIANGPQSAIAIGMSSYSGGIGSVALGQQSFAGSDGTVALGLGAYAQGLMAIAIRGSAEADLSMALGANSIASGYQSTAIGLGSQSYGENAITIGAQAHAMGANNLAVGFGAQAAGGSALPGPPHPPEPPCEGDGCWGIPLASSTVPTYSIAMGTSAQIGGDRSVALGARSLTLAENSVALGVDSMTDRANTVSVGASVDWNRMDQTDPSRQTVAAFTRQIVNVAAGTEDNDAVSVAQLHPFAAALGGGAKIELGQLTFPSYSIQGNQYHDVGRAFVAVDENLSQLWDSLDSGGGMVPGAVAYDSADKGRVTLAGAAGTTLTNLAAGSIASGSTDAINGGQFHASLQAMAVRLGGGSQLDANGIVIGTDYSIQGRGYANVGDALGALNAAVSGLDARVSNVEGGTPGNGGGSPSGTGNGLALGSGSHAADPTDTAVGNGAHIGADSGTAVGAGSSITSNATNSVAVGARASVTQASGTALGADSTVSAENSVALGRGSLADRSNSVSVGSAGSERQITNVAAGASATDAANVGQMRTGDAETLAKAKSYSESTASQTLNSAKSYTDNRITALNDEFNQWKGEIDYRFRDMDRRLDKMSAMSGAYAGMSMNTSGLAGQNRLGVGVGTQGGEKALAVGYQRAIGSRASVSLGGAFSGDEKSVMAGAGFSW